MEVHVFGCWEMKLWEGRSSIHTSDTKCHLGTKLQFQLLPFSTAVVILVDLSSSLLSSFSGNILDLSNQKRRPMPSWYVRQQDIPASPLPVIFPSITGHKCPALALTAGISGGFFLSHLLPFPCFPPAEITASQNH